MRPNKHLLHGMSFVLIGGTAAAVHLTSVYLLVHFALQDPLISNLLGFLIAFNVSFLGHKYITFSALSDNRKLSGPHFFLVSASAGLLNEFMYYMLLSNTQLNYFLALILVLQLVALYTYGVTRVWACR